jgi:hypothetical protein
VLKRVRFELGNELGAGEKSTTGVYAICKKKNDWPLRMTAIDAVAEAFRGDSRVIREARITQVFPLKKTINGGAWN